MSLASWLREGRVQRGLSLEDVSRVTKIQLRLLDRLESGRPEGLPADVFVRGFVRSFAKCVGLDEDEALRRYSACAPTSLVAPTSSAEATAAARAMVEAMADLAPMVARAVPAPRTPLASGSLSDLPKAAVVEALQAPAEAAVVVAPAPVEAATPRPIYQDRTQHAAVAVEAPVAVAVEAPAAVVAEVMAVEAPSTKKRVRKAAVAGGKSRGKRKPIATGTPSEASPVVAADAAAPASEAPAAPVKRASRARTNGAASAPAAPVPAPASEVTSAPAIEATGDAAAVPAIEAATALPIEATSAPVIEAALDTPSPIATAVSPWEAAPVVDVSTDLHEPQEGTFEEPIATATWRPKMPPAAATSLPPWRRPRTASAPASAMPAVPSLVIDDSDPDSAEQVLEERAAAKSVQTSAQRRSFLPPILLDREDRSARQGGLTLAVIILLIAATLTLSYLMRRPSSSGDGVTHRAAPAQLLG